MHNRCCFPGTGTCCRRRQRRSRCPTVVRVQAIGSFNNNGFEEVCATPCDYTCDDPTRSPIMSTSFEFIFTLSGDVSGCNVSVGSCVAPCDPCVSPTDVVPAVITKSGNQIRVATSIPDFGNRTAIVIRCGVCSFCCAFNPGLVPG